MCVRVCVCVCVYVCGCVCVSVLVLGNVDSYVYACAFRRASVIAPRQICVCTLFIQKGENNDAGSEVTMLIMTCLLHTPHYL